MFCAYYILALKGFQKEFIVSVSYALYLRSIIMQLCQRAVTDFFL